jgi:hypothetical protein
MISRICRGIRRLQDCVRSKGFDVAAKLRRRAKMFERLFERLKCSWHGGEGGKKKRHLTTYCEDIRI